MARRDNAYWQRLRKDRRSSLAALLAIAAGLFATVALIGLLVGGSQYQARANPIYWALLVPFGWWGSSLAYFEPWATRLLRPLLIGWPLLASIVLAATYGRNGDITAVAVLLGLCITCSAAAMIVYGGSMLQREGPAR